MAGIGFGILIPIVVVIVLIVLFVVLSRDRQRGDYVTYEHGEPNQINEHEELNPSEKSDNKSEKGV